MLFEPVDRLGIEVVGRFVEQEHVGLLKQEAAQGHAAAFATGEGVDFLVVGRTLQGVHRAFEFGVDVPCVGSVELVLKFGLTGDKGVHFVRVFEDIGVGEAFVDFVKLGKQIHDGLHTFSDNFDHSLVGG